jgi:hypothetical protein
MFIVFRIISLVLIVVALMLLGADAVTSLENNGGITVRSLETVWGILDKGSLASFKSFASNNFPGFLASWIFALLGSPGWAVTGVIGVFLAFIFGRRAGGE